MNIHELQVGDVVGVDVTFWGIPIEHVGVVVEAGQYGVRVVSNSLRRRGVVEETLEDFSEGAPVRRQDLRGELSPWEIVQRARERIGESWTLLSNCEHFVREVLGLERQSPQLLRGVVLVGAGLLGTVVVASKR